MRNKILNLSLSDDQIGIFYIGQVGYILKYQSKYIVIDAYLSDYVDRNCCRENVIWERNYEAPISANELDFIDYVFCTHSHFDHADPDTLSTLAKINTKAKFFASAGITSLLESYGILNERIVGMQDGENIHLCEEIAVTAIKAAHEEFHVDEDGNHLELGFKFAFGNTTLFHAGDGCPYAGLESTLMGCDILMLPVNGRDYYRTVVQDIIGCFTSREAILLAKNVGATLLIPTHFDLYDINCLNPACFVDDLQKMNPSQRFHIFRPGEGYIYF